MVSPLLLITCLKKTWLVARQTWAKVYQASTSTCIHKGRYLSQRHLEAMSCGTPVVHQAWNSNKSPIKLTEEFSPISRNFCPRSKRLFSMMKRIAEHSLCKAKNCSTNLIWLVNTIWYLRASQIFRKLNEEFHQKNFKALFNLEVKSQLNTVQLNRRIPILVCWPKYWWSGITWPSAWVQVQVGFKHWRRVRLKNHILEPCRVLSGSQVKM